MKLAIKGHPTRGKEVIEILEMLGGKNYVYSGRDNLHIYFIDNGKIRTILFEGKVLTHLTYQIFTLEEFLEKFPYKVGDKVIDIKTNRIVEIYKAHWSESNNCTYYDVKYLNNTGCVRNYKFLQPYEEETMEEDKKAKGYCTEESEDSGKNPKKAWFTFWCNDFADEVELCLEDKELVQKDGKWFVVKKKKEYPKTYIECAKSLECFGAAHIDGYKCELLEKLQELLICRDAYWKIAGEQMGLGKPWKPDWNDLNRKYFISLTCDGIGLYDDFRNPQVLAFPTKEMRDAFYENFKELTEQCKELL